jgi:hypothetical protein
MNRKKVFPFIFISLVVVLLVGMGSIYILLTRIYSPEQIDTNEDTIRMTQWELNDAYLSPPDGLITKTQLDRFLNVNRELTSFLFKVRQQFEENSWQIAFDIIRMRPEWIRTKYRALEKCHISPKEYDWIADRVIDFWVYRWKEESIERLKQYGWEFDEMVGDSTKPVNYELLLGHEEELYIIFDIIWPEKPSVTNSSQDSLILSTQEEKK